MLKIYDESFQNRLLLGTAQFPSLDIMQQAINVSGTEIVTVALKRELSNTSKQAKDKISSNMFWETIRNLNLKVLPNTAGCRTADEAIYIAQMAQQIFQTNWVKLEVIGDDYTLQPNPMELLKAAEQLFALDFKVLPYCTDDLVVCKALIEIGCQVLMPWVAPIGSGQGVLNPYHLQILRERFPKTTLIIDAGIGRPSDATQVMEMGFDAVLLNSAVSHSPNPIMMAESFKYAVLAGRNAFEAGIIPKRNLAVPSTPLIDTPFWQQEIA